MMISSLAPEAIRRTRCDKEVLAASMLMTVMSTPWAKLKGQPDLASRQGMAR